MIEFIATVALIALLVGGTVHEGKTIVRALTQING